MNQVCLSVEKAEAFDVVVCGAGSAGFCAAVAAARAGRKVALVEKHGMMGGIMTVGGNSDVGLFYAHKKQIISGIGFELMERLKENGGARYPDFEKETRHSRLNIMVNPFEAACMMDTMCAEANVSLYLNHIVCGVQKAGSTIKQIVVCSRNGLQALTAPVFIDCTGDGVLSDLAGAESAIGEEKELQPGTLRVHIAGFDLEKLHADQIEKAYQDALKTGELDKSDYWPMGGVYAFFKRNANNANHVVFDFENTSRLETEGRARVKRFVEWAKKHVAGAEHLRVVCAAPEVAMREWRRVSCDKTVTKEDYISGKKEADALCYSFYPIDLHQAKESGNLHNVFIEENVVPVIPYGAMCVKGIVNLLVAGRCIGSDRLANSALRVKASCMAMGQAAGAAAAVAAETGAAIRKVDLNQVKALLVTQNAIVPC